MGRLLYIVKGELGLREGKPREILLLPTGKVSHMGGSGPMRMGLITQTQPGKEEYDWSVGSRG